MFIHLDKTPECDGRTDRQTESSGYYSGLHCEQCGLAAKRYKTAADWLSGVKLGMSVVIKGDDDWRGVRRPQVAMHRNRHIFHIFIQRR